MNLDDVKTFFGKINSLGFPLPMMRDPKTGLGSVTVSLVIVSAVCVIISLISKKVDQSGAFSFYIGSLAAYLGRKYQTKDVAIDAEIK